VVNKIQKIASLKNHGDIEGELNSEKIVVLARNKYLFKSLEEALQAANIPHYYKIVVPPAIPQWKSGSFHSTQ
jgi:DNA helicase-2/ATP-dependent DNA helicase PcrA